MSLSPELLPSQPTAAEELDKCCACDTQDNVSWCVQCIDAFCEACWGNERPHKSGKIGENGLPHVPVNIGVFRRLKAIFDQPTEDHQKELHAFDTDTSWFGYRNDDKHTPCLYNSYRLIDLLYETQNGGFTDRFPHLVSFVGQTGAGKSTIIKMLMKHDHTRAQFLDVCPVPGRAEDNIPTTADVHLYADPLTGHTQMPILYADSEGMSGGEITPQGLESQSQSGTRGGRKVRKIIKNQIKKRLAWASDDKKRSREYSVKNLFPKILYTFSDIIVFILRDSSKRTFESEVFQLLLDWAATSIDKSINQPSRPHIIIVFNAAEATGDANQWNPTETTNRVFNDHKELVNRLPSQLNLPPGTDTPKKVLEHFYKSVLILKIPAKSLYMQVDDQITKLYKLIQTKCDESYTFKKENRMLLNTERLPRYVNAAFDHFSRSLDVPFDFVAEARRYFSSPVDFGGHILNFILLAYDRCDNTDAVRFLFVSLVRPLASCIMLSALRDNTHGTFLRIFQRTYKPLLSAAISEFRDKWLRCNFRGKKDGACMNTRTAHEKGHQSFKGAILGRGSYESPLDPDFFSRWMKDVEEYIATSEATGKLGEETVSIPRMHMENIKQFYTNFCYGSNLQSNLTCPCCIGRTPEYVLTCGHIICKACVQSIGKRKGPGFFNISGCPLHPGTTSWSSPIQIRYKPEEAGVRTLCLDGGGVKGIIELTILRAIEKVLGNHIQIQKFFDLIVGTSAGGIIALGLGVKNMTVDECLSSFKILCQQSFIKRVPRFWTPLAVAKGKSIYKSKPLENSLQLIFENTVLYGGSRSGDSAIRVAVTTTLAKENEPAVLSNYNRNPRITKASTPCTFIRPQNPQDELKVWEAARATSAAPPYFKPFTHERTMGVYADGAIHNHCPVFIADQERRQIWEDVKDWQPDIVLSIGSGTSNAKRLKTSSEINTAGFFSQKSQPVHGLGYLLRIASTIIERQLNCEEIWNRYCDRVRPANHSSIYEDNCRYFRLNAHFGSERFSFDEIGSIEKLEKFAQETFYAKQNFIAKVAKMLIAGCFYFETVGPTTRSPATKEYERSGNIRCRFHEDTPDLQGFGKILEAYCVGKFVLHFVVQNGDASCHTLEIERETIAAMARGSPFDLPKDIQIKASDQSGVTSIFLCLNVGSQINISGFPRQLYAYDSSALSEYGDDDETIAAAQDLEKKQDIFLTSSHANKSLETGLTPPPYSESEAQ